MYTRRPRPGRLTISVPEMAEQLGISRTKAYELARSQDFPVLRLGKRTLIPIDGLVQWINENTITY
ncbi:helix-turn-helix domain-containing protein [Eubacteriales bacterium OttesenSCG-928-M02]|nr:helix-turn-helix domain-containing protein [Eubacteriales bacterium OttesenSCG-928-M02]